MSMKLKWITLFLLLFLVNCDMPGMKNGRRFSYYFNTPAHMWEETFPLGNGRLGMMPDGGVKKENIVLNEISLWSGSIQDTDNPNARYYLPQIRSLLFEGRNDEAQALMYKTFVCKGAGSGHGHGAKVPYGSYQLLGNMTIQYAYPKNAGEAGSYVRTLSLDNAMATTSFRKGNVVYGRESFTSFSDDIGVIHLTADVDRMLNFTLGMNRPEYFKTTTVGNDLVMQGELPDGVDTLGLSGMKYVSRVRILLPKGGSIVPGDSTVMVKNASEVVLLVSMATNYKNPNMEQHVVSLLSKASKKDYAALKESHIAAYRKLFGRVNIDLGHSDRDNMPINERLELFSKDKNDPGLVALYFQFGRYLLISSTRVGSLPPNLQGLWCNTINTPWNGDYHLNINLQMNHWPVEVTNLPELDLPLTEWVKQQVPSGERTAQVFYNARGWVTHILGNVWQFTAPSCEPSWGSTNTAGAWLCQQLYAHYQFTMDKSYLRDVYPVMKGAASFFVDMLVKDPRNGYLVTAPTTSPENSYKLPNGMKASVCAGSTMDNQIVRELFTNTIEAASVLGCDSDFVAVLKEKRAGLMPTTIGKDGRIMEWLEPYEETDIHHRHVSHLFGLYPGNEISLERTPQLAEAARKSLEMRGDESTGWSMAWKINFWARLHDGNHAYKLIGDLLHPCKSNVSNYSKGGGTFPNLFCAHPPFQIDGNYGATAGIAEMLVQSQNGIIEFLPAIPTVWKSGSFSGLKVRGNAEVSAKWAEGKIVNLSLKALSEGTFRVKLPGNSEKLSIFINRKAASLPIIGGALALTMKAGDEAQLSF